MTFAEVLPALSEGREVRRSAGAATYVLRSGVLNLVYTDPVRYEPSRSADLLASDWELVEEPAPVPTPCDACLEDRRTLKATVARLERDLRDVSGAHAAQQEVNHRLEREAREYACVDCHDQRVNDYARGYCPKHGEAKRDEVDRLERELAEAKQGQAIKAVTVEYDDGRSATVYR